MGTLRRERKPVQGSGGGRGLTGVEVSGSRLCSDFLVLCGGWREVSEFG